MHQGHGHNCAHHHAAGNHTVGTHSKQRLMMVLLLTATFMIIEFGGGLWTRSLALLSDAAHMLSDVAALSIALIALIVTQRKASLEKSYGFHRAEVLAAFVNAIAVIVLAVMIFTEALHRLSQPEPIDTTPMLIIAVLGFGVNMLGALLLHSKKSESLNLRGVYLHILGDLLGSLAAIISGIAMILYQAWWVDAAVSILIAALIMTSGFKLLWDTVNILMQSVPAGIKLDDVRARVCALPHIQQVTDLHLWSLGSGLVVATIHVSVKDLAHSDSVLNAVHDLLMRHFSVQHVTVQIQRTGSDHEHKACLG